MDKYCQLCYVIFELIRGSRENAILNGDFYMVAISYSRALITAI